MAALREKGVAPERITYYSFDDPALMRREVKGEDLLDQLMHDIGRSPRSAPIYLFLDEIQRFERWELYLKKYYDLKFPVRVVLERFVGAVKEWESVQGCALSIFFIMKRRQSFF